MHLVFWTQSLVFWMVDLEFGMLHWSVWASALLLTIIITTTILLTSLDCLTGKYLQQLILSLKVRLPTTWGYMNTVLALLFLSNIDKTIRT